MQQNPSNQIDDEWQTQLTDYVMGAMEPEAAAEFGRSLEECRAHVRLADQYSNVAGWLGASVSPAAPPEGHRSRFVARLQETPQQKGDTLNRPQLISLPGGKIAAIEEPPQPVRGVAPEVAQPLPGPRSSRLALIGGLAAVAAALILLVGLWWRPWESPATTLSTIAYAVQGQDPMKNASGVVVINPQKKEALFVASGLQPLPAGKIYELWFLQGDKAPLAAGTFQPDVDGHAQHSAPAANLASISGVAVTLEPAPGVSAPTGPIVLVGKPPAQ